MVLACLVAVVGPDFSIARQRLVLDGTAAPDFATALGPKHKGVAAQHPHALVAVVLAGGA